MLTITPPDSPYRYAEAFLPEFSASGATGTVNWSTSSGTLSDATGASTVLTPLNRTQMVTITAEDDDDTVTFNLSVEATFPVLGNWQVESDLDDTPPEISVPELGPPRFRESSQITASWPYVFTSRMFESYAEVRSFLIFHRYSIPFWVEDMATGELVNGYRDSSLRRKPIKTNLFEFSFRFKVYDWQEPESLADIGPWASLGGGLLLEDGGSLLLEDGGDLLLD